MLSCVVHQSVGVNYFIFIKIKEVKWCSYIMVKMSVWGQKKRLEWLTDRVSRSPSGPLHEMVGVACLEFTLT